MYNIYVFYHVLYLEDYFIVLGSSSQQVKNFENWLLLIYYENLEKMARCRYKILKIHFLYEDSNPSGKFNPLQDKSSP